MGVTCVIIRAADATLDELVATPRKVWSFESPDRQRPPRKPSFLGRLLGQVATPDPICSASRQPGDTLDLDKAWDGIDFLLSNGKKDAGICRLLTMKSVEIHEEIGYGKPRVFHARQVQEFNSFLETVSAEALQQRYDPQEMTRANLYPKGIWNSWDRDEALDYVTAHYTALQSFIRETAQLNQGVIVLL